MYLCQAISISSDTLEDGTPGKSGTENMKTVFGSTIPTKY